MKKIFVAGHNGMVGSALCRNLDQFDDLKICTVSRRDLDLTNQTLVREFIADNCFEEVYLAAAKVGGIGANSAYPATFVYENLMIQSNVIDASYRFGVKKLLFLGSSCIYPGTCKQPIREEYLLEGALESTNSAYAVAKIAGIKMCESYNAQYGTDYRSIMPTNLYGPGDNFNLVSSHVIPALIAKFHQAKIEKLDHVELWGTGKPMREFLHVDDMADAAVTLMNLPAETYRRAMGRAGTHINVGYGSDISILDVAEIISRIVGYNGLIRWNTDMPDGTYRKLLDSSRLRGLGWEPSIELEIGLRQTYKWFISNQEKVKK